MKQMHGKHQASYKEKSVKVLRKFSCMNVHIQLEKLKVFMEKLSPKTCLKEAWDLNSRHPD